jgi:hypothetical protein
VDNNIKVHIKEIEVEIMPWINCAQVRDQGQDIVEGATKACRRFKEFPY